MTTKLQKPVEESAELKMFLEDVSALPKEKMKKVQAYVYLIMQLKRFSREELKHIYNEIDLKLKESEHGIYID